MLKGWCYRKQVLVQLGHLHVRVERVFCSLVSLLQQISGDFNKLLLAVITYPRHLQLKGLLLIMYSMQAAAKTAQSFMLVPSNFVTHANIRTAITKRTLIAHR